MVYCFLGLPVSLSFACWISRCCFFFSCLLFSFSAGVSQKTSSEYFPRPLSLTEFLLAQPRQPSSSGDLLLLFFLRLLWSLFFPYALPVSVFPRIFSPSSIYVFGSTAPAFFPARFVVVFWAGLGETFPPSFFPQVASGKLQATLRRFCPCRSSGAFPLFLGSFLPFHFHLWRQRYWFYCILLFLCFIADSGFYIVPFLFSLLSLWFFCYVSLFSSLFPRFSPRSLFIYFTFSFPLGFSFFFLFSKQSL